MITTIRKETALPMELNAEHKYLNGYIKSCDNTFFNLFWYQDFFK